MDAQRDLDLASFFIGYPFASSAHAGASVLVLTDGGGASPNAGPTSLRL
jgi:hypothetical protein